MTFQLIFSRELMFVMMVEQVELYYSMFDIKDKEIHYDQYHNLLNHAYVMFDDDLVM